MPSLCSLTKVSVLTSSYSGFIISKSASQATLSSSSGSASSSSHIPRKHSLRCVAGFTRGFLDVASWFVILQICKAAIGQKRKRFSDVRLLPCCDASKMTSYFNSRGPARASTRKGSSNLADLKLDLSDEDARSQLQSLPVKNKEAKQALFAKHVRDFPKWLLPLRCANPIAHQRVTSLICNCSGTIPAAS
jgi:hypothetical protein